jgi:hypothetical protein
MLERLSEGSWLSWRRMRAVALICGATSLILLLFLFATANGTLDLYGRPLGTDFSDVWAAGWMAIHGAAPDAWDWSKHYAVQQAAHHSRTVPFYGWHYPPPFLLVAALLARLPYVFALLVWQLTTLTAAALLLRRILPDERAVLLGLCAPVVFVCLGHGHNGFLTAALLAGGLFLIDRRPFLAGLLLGCLVYKPQFAVLIPPLLLVMGRWRALIGAAASAGILILATLVFWGPAVWEAFFHSLPLTQQVIIENGATGWQKIQSPFAMIRMWGGGIPAAYVVQAFATACSVGITLWLARKASADLRNAAATAAAILSTPYVLDYDYVVLGFGAAFLIRDGIRRGFLSYEKSLLALVWIAPLFARQLAQISFLPLGQATAVIVAWLAIRRAIALDAALPDKLRSWPFRHSHGWSGR